MFIELRRRGDHMSLLDVLWSLFPWEYKLCSWIRHLGAPTIYVVTGEIYCIRCCRTVTRGHQAKAT
jgi:hypothetical protein